MEYANDAGRANPLLVVAGLAIGLLVGLGLRSAIHEPPGHGMAAAQPSGTAHHDAPGHGEHGHDPAAAGTSPTPSATPDTGGAADSHSGHEGMGSMEREPAQTPASGQGLLLDLGNTTCPIMGGDPDGETFSEWNGLRVSHCCPACMKKFLADPEHALDEAGLRWMDAADAVAKVLAATGADRERELAEAGKRWTILRRPSAEGAK